MHENTSNNTSTEEDWDRAFEEVIPPGSSIFDLLELLTEDEIVHILSGEDVPTHESALALKKLIVERARLVAEAEEIAHAGGEA